VPASHIGTEKESSLHKALKFRYTGPEGRTETPVGNYVCDGTTGGGELIEVQTGSFGPLKEKVRALAKKDKVRIIYPVVIEKSIELYDACGKLLYKRKSPRKGSVWDLFKSLLYAPELALTPNVTIELVLVDTLERRVDDGSGSWRRKGVRIDDKVLAAWRLAIPLESVKDYYQFIPFDKEELFTTRDLAKKSKINASLARKCLYVLTKLNLVKRIGKQGNAIVYKISRRPQTRTKRDKMC
jgi:hypothetical protein